MVADRSSCMLALALTADLAGVTDLLPVDTPDEPYFYTFKVQCTSCREVHPTWVSISRYESNEISGSKGEANFVWRCKTCKRESTANIRNAPCTYTQASPPQTRNIIEMDCRGIEFTEFKADVRTALTFQWYLANVAQGEWTAKGLDSPTKFNGIDLQEGEWFDYDEKTSEEVSIREVKWEIRRA
ncbi:MAG: hypothetical protein Q9217_003463 [Psora testacea]